MYTNNPKYVKYNNIFNYNHDLIRYMRTDDEYIEPCIEDALSDPHSKHNKYFYLIQMMHEIALARGTYDIALQNATVEQLDKTINGDPTKNNKTILNLIGLYKDSNGNIKRKNKQDINISNNLPLYKL